MLSGWLASWLQFLVVLLLLAPFYFHFCSPLWSNLKRDIGVNESFINRIGQCCSFLAFWVSFCSSEPQLRVANTKRDQMFVCLFVSRSNSTQMKTTKAKRHQLKTETTTTTIRSDKFHTKSEAKLAKSRQFGLKLCEKVHIWSPKSSNLTRRRRRQFDNNNNNAFGCLALAC